MNISLPDTLRSFVEEEVEQKGYGTSSEYIRDLIRREQARSSLRTMLLDGAAAEPIGTADRSYFDSLKRRARRKV